MNLLVALCACFGHAMWRSKSEKEKSKTPELNDNKEASQFRPVADSRGP